jgi:outer membrane murein-binding lipoprotein Lpp
MIGIRNARAAAGLLSVVGLSLALSGCDYWPPALQAQIEQLRSEVQTLTMEKAQLQNQINELARGKQDLQTQVDDLNRVNREKTAVIAGLQNQLDAMRAKMAKAPAAKPAAKAPAKAPAKKKVTPKKR